MRFGWQDALGKKLYGRADESLFENLQNLFDIGNPKKKIPMLT